MTLIKLIVFDLDGVLTSTKEIHFKSLNAALINCGFQPVSEQDHLIGLDGYSTYQKLNKLGISSDFHTKIWTEKQNITEQLLISEIHPSEKLKSLLTRLKNDGFKLAVATNSIRRTTNVMLERTGILEFFDLILTNEDLKNPKPSPEIYQKTMVQLSIGPHETLILEDAPNGRLAAQRSGAYLLPIDKLSDVTYEAIIHKVNSVNEKTKWVSPNLNVVIPMAGAGSRFKQAGYKLPKPFIEIGDKTMIQKVVESLKVEANFIFLVQKEHLENYPTKSILNFVCPGCKIVEVSGITEGAACTVLLAKGLINNDSPLLIVNSDQLIDYDSPNFFYTALSSKVDASIMTFEANHPKWSYVRKKDGFVVEVAEKKVISNEATVGIYWYKSGAEFVKNAESMISKNIRTNNEFYVAPIFNEYISNGVKITTFKVDKMTGLGTPEDLQTYLNENSY